MKEKNEDWELERIESIKNRKRNLSKILDYNIVKQIKKDLKRERRSVKRSSKNYFKSIIDKELDNFKNNKNENL